MGRRPLSTLRTHWGAGAIAAHRTTGLTRPGLTLKVAKARERRRRGVSS